MEPLDGESSRHHVAGNEDTQEVRRRENPSVGGGAGIEQWSIVRIWVTVYDSELNMRHDFFEYQLLVLVPSSFLRFQQRCSTWQLVEAKPGTAVVGHPLRPSWLMGQQVVSDAAGV